jgi:capsular exopolysaccharide synthesis family protein
LLELGLRKQAPPVSVIQKAVKPREPSNPRWWINIPLGLLLGLVVGFGLTFLLELMDTSIKSPTDVSRRVDLPMLGMVPHLDDLEEEIADLRLAFMTNPNSLIGESFRQIRTTLQFSAPAAQLRSLLVTSALPGDGRSTVSLNLAAATAHSGRKVLVVDANFRQPMIRGLFPQAPESGLSNALVGQTHWKDSVREVHPNLFVLSCGPLPPNPSELLGSDAMRALLSELIAEYDQVVFDGAPCVLVTDPAVLSTLVDGVVLVVRASANTYGVVQRARDLLGRVGARMFGVVLNGIRVTAGGYLRKNYRTFYEYHAQSQTAPQQQLPR